MNEDIRIDLEDVSDNSKDDENRKELLWEVREEELLKNWMEEMKSKSPF